MTIHALQSELSREEYLAFDEASPDKHQFYQGEIFAMSGGTFSHARIATNLITRIQITGGTCQPINSDMRVTTPTGLDTYPDISVYCGEPELIDNDHTLLNPVLIVEVLSPTTRSYDKGDKFEHYRSIPTLQDYLLIDSEVIHVEHFQRKGKTQWLLNEYRSLTDELLLNSVDLKVILETLYQGAKLKTERV